MRNAKIVAAFFGGAVVAAALMFVVMKREQAPASPPRVIATTPPAAPAAAAPAVSPAQPAPAPPEAAKPAPMPPPVAAGSAHRAVRHRPRLLAKALPSTARLPKEPTLPPAPVIAVEPPVPDTQAMADDGEVVPAQVAPAPPHVVTLKQGTMLRVRIGETIEASARQPGDTFLATLEEPLVIDGFLLAERGAHVEGRVVEAVPAGRVKGVAKLGLELARVHLTDGQWLRIQTEEYVQQGKTAKKRDLAEVLGGSGLGAVIGAAAGGGAGAAIGAAAGGMAGGGAVMAQRGPDVAVPVETRITFRVANAERITEKLD